LNISKLLTSKTDKKTLGLIKQAGLLADSLGINAYLVGGTIRDVLLGKKPGRDMDLTVEGDGLAFAQSFADNLGASYKGFEKFRTARIFLKNSFRIDVASARAEQYPEPGMLPIVELAAINQDLYRRDFTVNAMAVRINKDRFGELLDPFGGENDLKTGTLRVLHDRSFIDDPTRLLRFIRFQSRFGFKPDTNTMELFNADVLAGVFDAVSGERLREELVLILKEKISCAAMRALSESGALAALAPGIRRVKAAAQALQRIEAEEKTITNYGADPLKLKLAAVLAATGDKYAGEFLNKFKFANDWKIAVFGIRRACLRLKALGKKLLPGMVHEQLEGVRSDALAYLEIVMAGKTARENIRQYRAALKTVKLSITGKTLIEMGIKPGKICGAILKSILVAKLNKKIKTRRQEIEFVERQIN
jgi:tRNA nucleotidyltransferase (CCA-adding enzyme)